MDVVQYSPLFRAAVATALSAVGFYAIILGLRTMLAQDYQQSLKRLSVQSAQIGQKAIGDVAIAPVLQAAAELITAVNQLVRTAVGVGVFLCLGGVLLLLTGYSLFPR
jgi:hypothetical protein